MINPELQAFIRQQLGSRVTKDTIKQTLSAKGWSEQDIKDAFLAIESPQAPPSTIIPPPVMQQPIVQAPPQRPAQSTIQPMTMGQPAKSGGHKGIWAIVIVIVLLLVAGGAYAAYQYLLAPLTPTTYVAPTVATSTTPVSTTTPALSASTSLLANQLAAYLESLYTSTTTATSTAAVVFTVPSGQRILCAPAPPISTTTATTTASTTPKGTTPKK